jgi:16S rRNA (uracil1498-N3)-methyltransferase
LGQWLSQRQEDQRIILHPHADHSLMTEQTQTSSVAVLIGPEGGFSEEEVNLASAQSFRATQLGPRILRTETAALVVLSILQFQLGDLK